MTATYGGLSTQGSFDVVGSKVVASDLTLVGPGTIQNSLANSVTLTATAVDANRNALPNIPISFSVDNGATLVPSGSVTNSAGVVTAAIRIGSDQSNRTINVTATSGTVVVKKQVVVSGANLSPSGFSSTVAVGSAGNRIVYLLVDNTGSKLSGYPITVRASGLADVAGATNADGEFLYTYTAPAAAQTLTIAATAGGAISEQSVAVAGTVVIPPADVTVRSASVSASPNVVSVNAAGASITNKVEIRALFIGANNAPVKNVRVWFDLAGDPNGVGGTLDSTSPGILLYSDANGVARTTYAPGPRSSPKDGITVRACWSANDFAVPSSTAAAPSASCPNAQTTTLTAVSESLSVTIGTDGTLAKGTSGLTYVQRFVVQVVDSAGQAKSGVQISPSIDLLTYYKGYYFVVGSAWAQTGNGNAYPSAYPSGQPVTYTGTPGFSLVGVCDNEDLNRNGVSESFFDTYEQAVIPEDQNQSGAQVPLRQILEPRKADVTISVEGSDRTDTSGIVVLRIEYPQNVASWVRYNILVAASGISGTEGRASYQAVLAVLSTAINDVKVDPPFKFSPYGLARTNTYLRRNLEGQSGWLCTNPD
jgi:hypothetical protein